MRTLHHSGGTPFRTIFLACLLFAAATAFAPAQSTLPTPTNSPTKAAPAARSSPAKTPPRQATVTPASIPTTNRPASSRFRPITKPAPSVRLTGGSRGTGAETVTLHVLAPEAVGKTIQAQPALYWFQSAPSKAHLEIAILQDGVPEPILATSSLTASTPGVHRLDLSKTDVRLSPGIEYQWVIALVTDPENRSTDLVASGFIERIQPDPALEQRLDAATPEAKPSTLIEAGLWYDALATLADRIRTNPSDTAALQARSELLRTVGLMDPALHAAP